MIDFELNKPAIAAMKAIDYSLFIEY